MFSGLKPIIIDFSVSAWTEKDFAVLRMEKAREQRAEKRLRYRWHARFASNPKQKPLSGQMVDVSSKGMAILYHNDENCPGPNQSITTNFGVPFFDSGDSFDTVFFNRTGRVCRVDNLTSKVNRIAIQFAEPLFFKPGEQDIIDSDAKQRLQAKAQLIVSAKEKAGTKRQTKVKDDNKAKSNAEETARTYSEALARAEERIRSYAKAKAEAEEKLKAEIEARHRSETKLHAEAEEKIRIYAEAKARAEEKAKAETKARAKAEAKTKTEAKLRARAEKKAETEAEKRAKIEAVLREKAESYAEQLAKVKTEAAREIAGIKAETDDTIAKIKTEFKPKAHKKKTAPKKDTGNKAKPSGEGILMDKVDKFITDRNRIF
ncbi:MAG TPA: hypothetical protein VMX36_13625 [Sedimentisphaerales bacterium]|nr:hypothetical protein [Sedimentisphaerales bacterium]